MRSVVPVLAGALLAAPTHARLVLLVSNETGMSIGTVNTATGAVGTYHSGLSNPDGLMFAPDGALYVTSFTGGAVRLDPFPEVGGLYGG